MSDRETAPAAPPRWEIRPEPTDEELVALVTVLHLTLAGTPASAREATPRRSRWARAGRLAATAAWPPAGFRRGRDREVLSQPADAGLKPRAKQDRSPSGTENGAGAAGTTAGAPDTASRQRYSG